MDRRDIPPEDRYGGGQSYRPGHVRNRSPPPRRDRDAGYGARSPPRRPYDNREPLRGGRSRSPAGRGPYRRRSPSPRLGFGGIPRGGDSYRTRPRSPLRREDGPREDLTRRDNPRDFRDERGPRNGRSPPRFRDRSPGQASPLFRGRRTPPGPRRDRSPPRRFDDHPASRPHSPPRRRFSPRGSDRDYPSRPRSPIGGSGAASDRRPRSPSPRTTRANREYDDRDRESGATSRKSSPPVHPSRLALVPDEEARSGRPSPKGVTMEVTSRPRTPADTVVEPPRDRDGDYVLDDAPPRREPPSGPSADRPPPTGPGSARTFAAPPAGPRGDSMTTRGGFAPRGRGGYNAEYATPGRTSISTTFRGRGGAPAFSRGPSYDREHIESTPRSLVPPAVRPPPLRTASTTQRFDAAGPAAYDTPREPRASLSAAAGDPYRRPPTGPSGATSVTTTRTVDSVHPAIRNLPEVIPNGRRIPPVADHSRLNKFEEESERLRKLMIEKDARKRRNLREWDRLVREGESATFRSDLAETSVRAYDGDGEVAGAAF